MNVVYENKSEPIIVMTSNRLSSLPHMHKEIEIIYVENGFSKAHADQERSDINSGDIFVCFPNQVHFYEKAATGKYFVLIISPKVFFGIKELIYSNVPEKNSFVADDILKKHIKDLTRCKEVNDLPGCVGHSNLIISKILSEITLKPTIKSADGTLRDIMEYCETHYTEDISLSAVASNTHLSKCYISHLFGSKLSIGFSDYINILRINAACELLTETNKKIADISVDVGYGTIRSFNRAFLKVMGTTPQDYRSGLI